MRVSYLGPPGTFSDEALDACDLAKTAQRHPVSTLGDAYEAALAGEVEMALLPIENSIEGAVGTTLDLLVHRPGLSIRREVSLPVHQHLMAAPGTSIEAVRRVLSHPQALGQCAGFLRAHLPGVAQLPTHSTADAARSAADEPGTAAIASRAAADRYGLEVLSSSIEDGEENTTRFVLLATADEAPTGRDRTSVALSLDRDRPGGLYEVLGELAKRDINLSKIESRPTKHALGHYVFFLDLEGHRTDPACAEGLEALRRRAHQFFLLGSYPRA
jgi:prephenate dehydratase